MNPWEQKWITEPTEGDRTGPFSAALYGFGRTADRMVKGVQQAYYGVTGDKEAQDKLAKQVVGDDEMYAQLRQARPWATALGEAAPLIAALPATGSIPLAAAAGAVPGLIEYGTPQEKGVRAGLGAAGGAVGTAAANTLGRVLQPMRGAAIKDAAATADNFAPITAGQASGDPAMLAMENTLSKLPGSSARMNKFYEAQREAVNKSALGLSGMEPAAKTSREALDVGLESVGGRVGDTAKRVPNVVLDDQAISKIADVERNYGMLLDAQQKPAFKAMVDDIINRAVGGRLTGEAYQRIRSNLALKAQGMKGADKEAWKGLQKALDEAATRSAPEDVASALTQARGEYRNLKSIEDLLTNGGDISTARLATRGTKHGKLSSDMQGVADYARIVSKQTPDSGTAQRSWWQELLTNPANLVRPPNLVGATGLPFLAANAITRQPVRGYLTNGLLDVTPEMERRLLRGGGLLGIAGGEYVAP